MGIKNKKEKKKPQAPVEFEEQKPADAEVETLPGDQPDLIDVNPEGSKEILRIAKRYNKAKKARMSALAVEVEEKENLKTALKGCNLNKLSDGSIRYQVQDFVITLKPCDEKLTVKCKDDEGEEDDE